MILECADPGGTAAQLPTSISTCDENTVQADTVLVEPNGSFSEKSYTLYSLPNAVLGEQSNWQPVCDVSHQCVLFVGENQNDFTQPKVFSAPFSLTPSTTSAPVAGVTPAAPTGTVPSAAVSLPAATLAFTGIPTDVWWLTALGLVLLGFGALSRTLARRLRR